MAAIQGCCRSHRGQEGRLSCREVGNRTENPWLGRVEIDALDSLFGIFVSTCKELKGVQFRLTSERAKSWRCTWRTMLASHSHRDNVLGGRAAQRRRLQGQNRQNAGWRQHELRCDEHWSHRLRGACGQLVRDAVPRCWGGRCATCLHIQPHVGQWLFR